MTALMVGLVGCGGSSSAGANGAGSPSSPAAHFPATAAAGSATASVSPRAASTGPRTSARNWSSQPAAQPRQQARPVRLVSLRSAVNVENGVRFDRLVLEFADGVPGYRAQFVPQVVQPGSGAPLPLAGQAAFELVLTSAAAHDDQGASTLRTAPDGTGPSGLSYALAGDFEGTVHIGASA